MTTSTVRFLQQALGQHVLAELAKGSSNQTITDTLGMSVRTVETRLSHIYLKLGVDCAAAVRCVLPNGLADNAT